MCIQMSLSANRREVIAGAGAAAVVAPMLRPNEAEAKDLKLKAPVITIFDNRGCDSSRNPSRESTARKTGGPDDEMCIKVRNQLHGSFVKLKHSQPRLDQFLTPLPFDAGFLQAHCCL